MKKAILLAVALCAALALSARAADVKENWTAHCAKCHGEDGKGETKMGKKAGCKDYSKVAVQDDKAFKSVKEGMKEGDKEVMKPFADKLSDEELKALIAHMKSFKK